MANIERLKPSIGIDNAGKITWNPTIVQFNPDQWYRGKTLSNEEFNNLFIQQVVQGNYTADSLAVILGEHLNTSIRRTFQADYQVIPSYTKVFTTDMWQEPDAEGYYHIIISSDEHEFLPLDESNFLEGFNIDVDMYLLVDGKFCQVQQYSITQGNLVTLYSDTNKVPGYVVIRSNDRSYSLSGSNISAEFITGLADVATSNNYLDLANRPDAKIDYNTSRISALEQILNPENPTVVQVSEYAKTLDSASKISNVSIADIFEPGSNYVKNATRATTAEDYTADGDIATRFTEMSKQITSNSTQSNNAITSLSNTVTNNYNTLSTNISRIINGTTVVSKSTVSERTLKTPAAEHITFTKAGTSGATTTYTLDNNVKFDDYNYLTFMVQYETSTKEEYENIAYTIPCALFTYFTGWKWCIPVSTASWERWVIVQYVSSRQFKVISAVNHKASDSDVTRYIALDSIFGSK